ncbi:MAG: hypothetical protein JSV04_02485 [Candidatus Heimdallarchaeota archaeon]|nr:MAG: hypothetical protein JSV04_02485 [Candidatus Heimdallarchaeota archaeon]
MYDMYYVLMSSIVGLILKGEINADFLSGFQIGVLQIMIYSQNLVRKRWELSGSNR